VEERRKTALDETDGLLETTRRELEKIVAEVRKSQAGQSEVKSAHKFIRESQARVGEILQRARTGPQKKSRMDRFAVNDRVRIISLNSEGEITELIGHDRARVQVGAMTTVAKLRDLEKLTGHAGPKPARRAAKTPSVDNLNREIHLRGMTVEEATEALDRFLDQAVVAGLHQVYVIHGKGTGSLRRGLTDYLKNHPEVESLSLGNWNEGGAGVTIVKLKT